MRKTITLGVLFASIILCIYFSVNVFYLKEQLIQSSIGLIASLLSIITTLIVWNSSTTTSKIKTTSTILGVTILVLVASSYINPSIIPTFSF